MQSVMSKLVPVVAAAMSAIPGSHAQEWPTGPLRIVVGSAASGGADTMARLVSSKLSPALKVTVIVENKPGATGTLAAETVARATDGQTLLMGTAGMQTIIPHMRKLPYDHMRDLVPVAMLASMPQVLIINKSLRVNSVTELIALAKKRPRDLNFASSGYGSAQQIAAELFQEATGTALTHIPYKGSSAAMVDLIAGNVQMNFDTLPSAVQFIRNGRVRALAVMSARRNPQIPEVPTMMEAGVKGAEMSAWYGILGPSSLPKAVQERLHAELSGMLSLPDTKAQLDAMGVEPMPMTQAQFVAFQAAENKRFAALVKQRNIKIE